MYVETRISNEPLVATVLGDNAALFGNSAGFLDAV